MAPTKQQANSIYIQNIIYELNVIGIRWGVFNKMNSFEVLGENTQSSETDIFSHHF